MKTKRTKIILLVVMVLQFHPVMPDCPHCFRLARVSITVASGQQLIGYMPFYGEVYNKLRKDSLGINDDVTDVIKDVYETFQFVDSIFSLPIIGTTFIQENITKISLDTILNITYLEEMAYAGAGYLVGVRKNDAEVLSHYEIVNYGWVHGNVSDEVFINLSTDLDSSHFRTMINYTHLHPRGPMLNKLYALAKSKASVHDEGNLDYLKEVNSGLLHEYNEAIKALAVNTSDPVLNAYFSQLHDFYLYKCQAHEALAASLETLDFSNLWIFIEKWNKSMAVYNKNDIEKILCDKELDGLEKYYRLAKFYYSISPPNWKKLNDMFWEIIRSYDIVHYSHSFD